VLGRRLDSDEVRDLDEDRRLDAIEGVASHLALMTTRTARVARTSR